MKRFFFLQNEISFGLIGLMIWAFVKPPLIVEIPVLLMSSLVLFLFRRRPVNYVDTLKNDGEIYLSPVHGVVESVRYAVEVQDFPSPCHEVRISLNFWDEKGLYLPTTGELTYLRAIKGIKVPRKSTKETFFGPLEKLSHTEFSLLSKNQNLTLMRFIDFKMGKRPTIWLKSGDRGRAGACFGYYPFGGNLLVYLPITSDILVFENEQVVPGQSVIASLKDQPKV